MRSRRKVSNGCSDARAISTPNTSDPVLYIHRSPGWCMSGSDPRRADPLVGPWRGRRVGRSLCEERPRQRPQDRCRVRRRHHQAETHQEREQVAHGDRPVRGHGLVERPVELLQHLAVGELGHQSIDGLVEPQLALLHEDHRRRRGDGLGHRGDPEDRVAPRSGSLPPRRLRADRVDVDRSPPADQRDDPGDLVALDVAGHHVVHTAEPRLGQSSGAHRVLLPSSIFACIATSRPCPAGELIGRAGDPDQF